MEMNKTKGNRMGIQE